MRLQYKLPLVVMTATLLAGMATGAFFFVDLIRARTNQLEQKAAVLTNVVQASLESSMLGHRPDLIPITADRLQEQPLLSQFTIVAQDGRIASSFEPSELGQTTTDPLVWDALHSGQTITATRRFANGDRLSLVLPIANKPECRSCHAPQNRVLGAILVGLDASGGDAELRGWFLIRGIHGAIVIFLVGGILSYKLRRMILSPLAEMGRYAQSFSSVDHRIESKSISGDEVSKLARTFHDLVQRVTKHNAELAHWNERLESTVEQRTQQLVSLNPIVAAAGESLNLNEMLRDMLSKVLATTGADAGMVCLQVDSRDCAITVTEGFPADQAQDITRVVSTRCAAVGGSDVETPAMPPDRSGQDRKMHEVLEAAGLRSHARLPIVVKGELIGSLCVFSRDHGFPGKHIKRVLAAMADTMAIGVRNALISRRLQEANNQLGMLLERAMDGGFDVRFDNPHLVACWIEKECGNVNCPAYESPELRCWQLAGTFCPKDIQGRLVGKLTHCRECVVFQKSCGRDEISSIGESFNTLMFLLNIEAQERATMRQQMAEKLMLAQEEERRRIARELHDQVGQSLTLVLVDLAILSKTSAAADVTERVAALQSLAADTLDDVRRLAVELRPSALDNLGLVVALRGYLLDAAERSGIPMNFRTSGLRASLAPAVETALYRIVQESVTNAIRHAKPHTISVTLEQHDNLVLARIRDDGTGFHLHRSHPSAMSMNGLGITGMRERAALLGG
ncbi:MAG: HAMP domain-containing protein, partial [Chloroflexota bacterium]